jgi:PIN domain nuclease of toxin-antitoxin system
MPSVVVIDTHILVHDALEPGRLSARARRALDSAEGRLAASDISLWEIAMLIARNRIQPGADAATFIEKILESRAVRVLPITPAIAVLAQSDDFEHADPADRIIAATAIVHGAQLVTADAQLKRVPGLRVLW